MRSSIVDALQFELLVALTYGLVVLAALAALFRYRHLTLVLATAGLFVISLNHFLENFVRGAKYAGDPTVHAVLTWGTLVITVSMTTLAICLLYLELKKPNEK